MRRKKEEEGKSYRGLLANSLPSTCEKLIADVPLVAGTALFLRFNLLLALRNEAIVALEKKSR